ncbi:MAG: DUF5107 domain-containing protein [Candidatus Glassbacteria bacterium]|nr:DUF5107 domain-containing protein [Candidatus Glassbacteria bacterium]
MKFTFGPLIGILLLVSIAFAEVRVYQDSVILPSYRIGEPEIMPRWRVRFGQIYPYTMQDSLSDDRAPRAWHALYAENEWVRVMVLPEIGGRVHGAQDLTNGYQFMQDQRSIKPALVGMAGAWISGGVEWNFPDGHRISGFRPADWRIEHNPDGSKTIWTGEIERVYGMRWAVGNTVHPDRNWVETRVRLTNCTPVPHAFLYWADCGVRGTPEFTAVIPGEIATGHGKHRFFHWPLQDGKDLRMWKNAPGGTSYFAFESEADYFGTWSPEENGGIVHVADHHVMRGKKLWFCGTSPAGRLWEVVLTDNDAPLVEPQAGAYSDNQPDYHWIRPGETKVFSHFWFPVRDIGKWHFANLEGSLALRVENGKIFSGWCPTTANQNAKAVLTYRGRELLRESIDTDPGNPFRRRVEAPDDLDLYDLHLAFYSASGDTLLAFSHPRPENPPLPEPAPPFPAPMEIASSDSLFLIGDHLERFRERALALEYWNEALSRDPGDTRCNTAVGLVHFKQGLYEKALEYFRTALKRDREFAEARYYSGLCHLKLGDSKQAERQLNIAAYDAGWYAAAHFELAQLSGALKRYAKALEHIERSLRANADNMGALAVKALVLNRLGRHDDALAVCDSVQRTDRLDLLSAAEREVALIESGRAVEASAARDSLLAITRLDGNNHLELAVRYIRCGQWRDAAAVLELAVERGLNPDTRQNDLPLILYYLSYCNRLLGENDVAASWQLKTRQASYYRCFPNRLESYAVLENALEHDPRDSRALFYLGTLCLAHHRSEQAVDYLRRATEIEPGNEVAQRNLGYALMSLGRLEQARAAYEAAIDARPDGARAILELDMVLHDLGIPPANRIGLFESHPEAVNGNDPLSGRLVSLYMQLDRYDDALAVLTTHRFHSWEGRYGIHRHWVQCRIKLGDRAFERGDYEQAHGHYLQAMEYPDNLEAKEQPRTIHARKRYKIGIALAALGRESEAKKIFQLVLEDKPRPGDPYLYHQGRALQELGEHDRARAKFQRMLDDVDVGLERPESGPPSHAENSGSGDIRQALLHFKRALALEGLGRGDEASGERELAFELDPEVELRAFAPPAAGW